MARTCYLAVTDRGAISRLTAASQAVGIGAPATVVRLNVTELARLAPNLLICDIDDSEFDALELLRRIRFVLPDCLIVVYTAYEERSWAMACHLAGANGLLSKSSDDRRLVVGLRRTLGSGCYTDPGFTKSSDNDERFDDGAVLPRLVES